MAGRDKEVASLVRRAKSELRADNRREALSLLQKALAIDPESNAVTEAILQIERESASAGGSARKRSGGAAKAKRTAAAAAEKRRTGSGTGSAGGGRPSGGRTRRKGKKAPQKRAKAKTGADAESKTESAAPGGSGSGASGEPEVPTRKRKSGRRRRLRAVPDALDAPADAPKKEAEEATGEEPPKTSPPTEREGSMASSDQLQTLLETTEDAMRAGDDARAVGALKKARSLAPEDDRVVELTERYKASRKARKAMALSRKALDGGNRRKAVAYARKAFELHSGAPGIEELLRNLEEGGEGEKQPSAAEGTAKRKPARKPAGGGEADSYVQKIREKIQISSFPEAAKLTEEALDRFPDNELLKTFGDKFRKMGLID